MCHTNFQSSKERHGFLWQIQKLNQAKIQEEIYIVQVEGMGFDCCARRPRIQKFLLGTIHTSYGNRIGQLTSPSTMSFEIVPFLPSLCFDFIQPLLPQKESWTMPEKAGCLRKLDEPPTLPCRCLRKLDLGH